jgi:hypothetical protein
VRRAKFVCGRRVSAVACLTLDGIVSKRVVEGSLDQAMFCEWLEFSVVHFFCNDLPQIHHSQAP